MSKFKKYSRYKEFENYIGDIPEEWNSNKFKVILQERNMKNKPIISKERLSLSIDKGVTLYAEKTTNLDRFKEDFTQYKIAYPKDLVLNSMNVIVGAAGVSKYLGCVSPAYYVFYSSDETKYLTDYYYYFFKTSKMQKKLYSIGRGIMAIDRGNDRVNTCRLKVSKNDLKNLIFPVPKINEQYQIVKFIKFKEKQINKLIKKQKKLIELLEEKKKIIITEAVTKGLDKSVPMKDSGIDYIGQIPQNWEIIKLKFISLCNKYSLDEHTDKNRQINYIDIGSVTNKDGITNVQKMLFSEAPSRARRIIHTNDTIISTVRTYLKAIAYIDEKYDNYICSTGFAVITPKNNIDPKFLFYILHSENFICKVERISTGANYPAITANKLINLKCIMPSLQEQKNIIKYIENIELTINKLIENKNNLINKLEEYKKSLIALTVTGQIDVRDYEIPKTDDDVDLEEIENFSEDDTETISEVEYANN